MRRLIGPAVAGAVTVGVVAACGGASGSPTPATPASTVGPSTSATGAAGAAGAAGATASPASTCVPVRVLGFRGSGDPQVTDPQGNGWSGPLLTAIAIRSRSLHFADGHDVGPVPVEGVDYAAISAANLAAFATGLSGSVQDGVTKGLAAVTAATAGCVGRTHVVLTGYSQGAMVARQVAVAAPKGTVSGVFLVGDPDQRPDADGTQGPGRDGQGLARELFGTGTDDYYSLPIDRVSYCHAGDPVCAFSAADVLSPAGAQAHSSYGDDPAELTGLALALANLERQAAGLPAAQAS